MRLSSLAVLAAFAVGAELAGSMPPSLTMSGSSRPTSTDYTRPVAAVFSAVG